METSKPILSLITVNYNSKAETLDLLKSLQKSSFKDFEIIVVDNASKVNPKADILNLYPTAVVIIEDRNWGFAGANNIGLQKAQGDYIFFVNNDTELTPDCLQKLYDTAIKTPNLGALSPKFQFFYEKPYIEYIGTTHINKFTARNSNISFKAKDEGQFTGLRKTFYAHGGGMLVPKTVINAVGPMSEAFFLYYEEMDWCERIRKAGYDIYCQRDALLYHKESASMGKLNPLKTYYLNRNRILFMKRNYKGFSLIPFLLFFSFISFPKNVLSMLLKGDFKHLKAFLKGVFWHFNKNLQF